jgi:hypothetical protein
LLWHQNPLISPIKNVIPYDMVGKNIEELSMEQVTGVIDHFGRFNLGNFKPLENISYRDNAIVFNPINTGEGDQLGHIQAVIWDKWLRIFSNPAVHCIFDANNELISASETQYTNTRIFLGHSLAAVFYDPKEIILRQLILSQQDPSIQKSFVGVLIRANKD